MKPELQIKIIGLGGIGSILSDVLCRYLNYLEDFDSVLTLIDGDEYESKNQERQSFDRFGNKASAKQDELKDKFCNLQIKTFEEYITKKNITKQILNKDIILMGVDNHKTRKIVSDHCKNLRDVTLISGGNDLTDGNVQIFIRANGIDITPSLTDYHPEIKDPEDKHPSEMSCEDLHKSEPQLLFTNLTVATLMCWSFYNIKIIHSFDGQSEIYFDILKMAMDAKIRFVNQSERGGEKLKEVVETMNV